MPASKDLKLNCIVTSSPVVNDDGWFMRTMLSDKSIHVTVDAPPSIRHLVQLGLDNTPNDGAFAIVNDDIILGPEVLRIRTAAKPLGLAWAATSFRYDFDNSPSDGRQEGQGLDVFILTPTVARHIVQQIPEFLHLGRGGWDNWMCGWLRKNLPDGRFWDFTHWRCVFHRRHESGMSRFAPFTPEEQAAVLHNVSCSGVPNTRLSYPL